MTSKPFNAYPVVYPMGFTKEQRIKGLKKQLANLGEAVDEGPEDAVETGRGSHTAAALRRNEEAF